MTRVLFLLLIAVSQAMTQHIGLNHFYVTVDSPTYRAIRADPYLRQEFAPSEERTTVRTDSTYTGLYFYGRKTYWEFFEAGAAHAAGDSAIAFGVDEPGIAAGLTQKLGGLASPLDITREWQGKQQPWFHAVYASALKEGWFRSWLMEYDPRFLASWRPSTSKSNHGIGRDSILERYVDVLATHPAQPALSDVESITVALDAATGEHFREYARGLGLSVNGSDVETADVRIHIVPVNGGTRGIRQVTLRLRHAPASDRQIRFSGTGILRLNKSGAAEWTF